MMGAPWFKIWAKELLSDQKITLLEDDELGKLLKLWAFAQLDGCTIPSSPEAIAKLLRIHNQKQMVKHLVWIRQFFAPVDGDPTRLVSHRLLREQQAYDEKCEKLRANGSKGGRPPKPKAEPDGLPDGEPKGEPKEEPDGNLMGPEVGRRKKEKEVQTAYAVCGAAPAPPLPTLAEERVGKPRKPKLDKPKATAEPSLEEILGGKGSQTWERFWKLVGCWNRDKIPAPKRVALAMLDAFQKDEPARIYEGALGYRDEFLPPNRKADETQFMKSPVEWLQQEGWRVQVHNLEAVVNA